MIDGGPSASMGKTWRPTEFCIRASATHSNCFLEACCDELLEEFLGLARKFVLWLETWGPRAGRQSLDYSIFLKLSKVSAWVLTGVVCSAFLTYVSGYLRAYGMGTIPEQTIPRVYRTCGRDLPLSKNEDTDRPAEGLAWHHTGTTCTS